MKYRIIESDERKLDQFARSNFAELFVNILRERERQLNECLRRATTENFQQVQGRALEVDELLNVLKIKEHEE